MVASAEFHKAMHRDELMRRIEKTDFSAVSR
jgi:hypothetical protein